MIAGGRYDALIETMGGPPTAGTGWAGGIERLALLIGEPPAPRRPIALVPIGAEAQRLALRLSAELRRAGFTIELGYRGNPSKRLKRANKLGACAAVILGEDEIAGGLATVRDLDTSDQEGVPFAELTRYLNKYS